MADTALAPGFTPSNVADQVVGPTDKTYTAPTPAPSSALLVTSNGARTQNAADVSKLQGVTGPTEQQRQAAMTDAGLTSQEQTNVKNGVQSTPSGGGTVVNIHPDGSGASSASDGSAEATDPNAEAVKGIKDPALAAQYKSSLDSLDKEHQQASDNLEAAKATLANDPAAAQAIDSIKQKYDVLIQTMKDRNAQVIGRANTSVAAFGGLGTMGQSFLNDQMSRADQRVSDLVAQEQDLILKATIAYKNSDSKALNVAMAAYDKTNADKLKAIGTLLSETNKAVAQAQAQQKIDQTTQKNALAADISKSTNVATSIAKNIEASGITDQAQIDKYIQQVAEDYGISNPEILRSAIEKATQANTKAADASANTADTIANRDARTKIAAQKKAASTTPKVTVQTATATLDAALKGGNLKGKDGYIDDDKWIAQRDQWIENKLPVATFNTLYKKYLNPAAYSKAGFKATTSTSSTYKTN